MDIDKEREAFEKWYVEHHGSNESEDRLEWCESILSYEHDFVGGMFHTWQIMAKREQELLAEIERLKKVILDAEDKLNPPKSNPLREMYDGNDIFHCNKHGGYGFKSDCIDCIASLQQKRTPHND